MSTARGRRGRGGGPARGRGGGGRWGDGDAPAREHWGRGTAEQSGPAPAARGAGAPTRRGGRARGLGEAAPRGRGKGAAECPAPEPAAPTDESVLAEVQAYLTRMGTVEGKMLLQAVSSGAKHHAARSGGLRFFLQSYPGHFHITRLGGSDWVVGLASTAHTGRWSEVSTDHGYRSGYGSGYGHSHRGGHEHPGYGGGAYDHYQGDYDRGGDGYDDDEYYYYPGDDGSGGSGYSEGESDPEEDEWSAWHRRPECSGRYEASADGRCSQGGPTQLFVWDFPSHWGDAELADFLADRAHGRPCRVTAPGQGKVELRSPGEAAQAARALDGTIASWPDGAEWPVRCLQWRRPVTQQCYWGAQCTATDCRCHHPADWRPPCARGVHCAIFACWLPHPEGRTPCCTPECPNPDCERLHPDDWDPQDAVVPSGKSAAQRRSDREHAALPILQCEQEFVRRLKSEGVLVVKAETGSGKTTQLPQYAAEAMLPSDGSRTVVCTQPRLVATLSIAQRVADEWDGCDCGVSVGYEAGGKRCEGARINFLTDAALVKLAQADRDLQSVGVLVVDEAHERSLNTDVVLQIARDVRSRRQDFYVVISSATIDESQFLHYFGCPREALQVPGRTFPVEKVYRPLAPQLGDAAVEEQIRSAVVPEVLSCLERYRGHVLCFLHGMQPVERAVRQLRVQAPENCVVYPLYGALPPEEQTKIMRHPADTFVYHLRPRGGDWSARGLGLELRGSKIERVIPGSPAHRARVRVGTHLVRVSDREIEEGCAARKIDHHIAAAGGRGDSALAVEVHDKAVPRMVVCCTNVAETSLTVPGVRVVVDMGLVNEARYDVRRGMNVLEVRRVSRSSATQRAGRAGRTAPGTCVRLYAEEELVREAVEPEIKRSSLDQVLLQMCRLRLGASGLMDAPDPDAVQYTLRNLIAVGALTESHQVTERGKLFSDLPFDPRLSSFVLDCAAEGKQQDALDLAALLTSPGSIFFMGSGPQRRETIGAIASDAANFTSDLFHALACYRRWQRADKGGRGKAAGRRMRAQYSMENRLNNKVLEIVSETVRSVSARLRHSRFAPRERGPRGGGARADVGAAEVVGRALCKAYRAERLGELLVQGRPDLDLRLVASDERAQVSNQSYYVNGQREETLVLCMEATRLPNGRLIASRLHPVCREWVDEPDRARLHGLLPEVRTWDNAGPRLAAAVRAVAEALKRQGDAWTRWLEVLYWDRECRLSVLCRDDAEGVAGQVRRAAEEEVSRVEEAPVEIEVGHGQFQADIRPGFRVARVRPAGELHRIAFRFPRSEPQREARQAQRKGPDPGAVSAGELRSYLQRCGVRQADVHCAKALSAERRGEPPRCVVAFRTAQALQAFRARLPPGAGDAQRERPAGRPLTEAERRGCQVRFRVHPRGVPEVRHGRQRDFSGFMGSVDDLGDTESGESDGGSAAEGGADGWRGAVRVPSDTDDVCRALGVPRLAEPIFPLHGMGEVEHPTEEVMVPQHMRVTVIRVLPDIRKLAPGVRVHVPQRHEPGGVSVCGPDGARAVAVAEIKKVCDDDISVRPASGADQPAVFIATFCSEAEADRAARRPPTGWEAEGCAVVHVRHPLLFDGRGHEQLWSWAVDAAHEHRVQLKAYEPKKRGAKEGREGRKGAGGAVELRRFEFKGPRPSACGRAAAAFAQQCDPETIRIASEEQATMFAEIRDGQLLEEWQREDPATRRVVAEWDLQPADRDRDPRTPHAGRRRRVLLHGMRSERCAVLAKIGEYHDSFSPRYCAAYLSERVAHLFQRGKSGEAALRRFAREWAGRVEVSFDSRIRAVIFYVRPGGEVADIAECRAALAADMRLLDDGDIEDAPVCSRCGQQGPLQRLELCGHYTCAQCLQSAMASAAARGDPLTCGAPGCGRFVATSCAEKCDQDAYQALCRAAIRFHLRHEQQEWTLCPTQGCDGVHRAADTEARDCPLCRKLICIKCSVSDDPRHRHVPCEVYQQRVNARTEVSDLFEEARAFVRDNWPAGERRFVCMDNNPCLEVGCPTLRSFMRGVAQLPEGALKRCLWGWHGTPTDENVVNICHHGWDPNKRTGQAYGVGEYHARPDNAHYSMQYSGSTKHLIVSAILPGLHVKECTHYVVNNPLDRRHCYNLPVLVVTMHGGRPLYFPCTRLLSAPEGGEAAAAGDCAAAGGEGAHRWYWEDSEPQPGRWDCWNPYDDELCEFLEAAHGAYQQGDGPREVRTPEPIVRYLDAAPSHYVIDFARMVQRREHTGFERPIKRALPSPCIAPDPAADPAGDQWWFMGDDMQWGKIDPHACRTLSKALAKYHAGRGPPRVDVSYRGREGPYEVDFITWMQRNRKHGTERQVTCLPQGCSPAPRGRAPPAAAAAAPAPAAAAPAAGCGAAAGGGAADPHADDSSGSCSQQ